MSSRSTTDRVPPVTSSLAGIAERLASAGGPVAVARAFGSALGCSLILRDATGTTIVVAARSGLEEQSLPARSDLAEHALKIGGEPVGSASLAWHGEPADRDALEVALGLLAASVALTGDGAGRDAGELAGLYTELLAAGPEGPDPAVVERIGGLDPSTPARTVLVVRAQAITPLEEDWRERLLQSVAIAASEAERRAVIVAASAGGHGPFPVVVVPGEPAVAQAVAEQVGRELEVLSGRMRTTVGSSRPAGSLADLPRARDEALLAANVALAGGEGLLAFEDTGSYRLLLPALSSDAAELERFFDETVAPLVAYDRQYQTELLRTVEAFLDNDGNVAGTAQALFTHRHTVRYRLERVRELAGLDVGSSEGREQLSLGLKAMRVLGIAREQSAEQPTTLVAQPRSRVSRRS